MSEVRIVVFSGGRGSQVLSKELVGNPEVRLTMAINGYDDGKSTGEVRRFLGGALGPSDFRKNASTLAHSFGSCPAALLEILDLRFPDGFGRDEALASLALLCGTGGRARDSFEERLTALITGIETGLLSKLQRRIERFVKELERSDYPFSFSDCSIGNLVFAGSFLICDRNFNFAVDDYSGLLGLPVGMIENVTDGKNAHLVAIARNDELLASEAAIVEAPEPRHIEDLYLVDEPVEPDLRPTPGSNGEQNMRALLSSRSTALRPNPRLLQRIAEADIIVYAPGTQHSSLFPSYLTPGIGLAIARNSTAVKVLVTNLQEDHELADTSAVDILKRALYYLREKDQRQIPSPFLITHCLLNDSTRDDRDGVPYIPLGRLQSLEDPRLVRIANYEDEGTGRHHARKVLTPFVRSYAVRGAHVKVMVLLLDTDSLDKISQTVLEAVRAELEAPRIDLTFCYWSQADIDPEYSKLLPYSVVNVRRNGETPSESLLRAAREHTGEFVVLFESSGMYRGEDIISLVSLLAGGRLDAVWGSRRLSVRDIRQSYQLRYSRHPVLGAVSYMGSHVLSLIYLMLYGRYVSDVFSGARAVKTRFLAERSFELNDKILNQHLLADVLRAEGEIFETPVQFFPMSPEKANRTTVLDGLNSLITILRLKFRRR